MNNDDSFEKFYEYIKEIKEKIEIHFVLGFIR